MGEQLIRGRKNIILRISTPYGFNITKKKITFLEFIVSNLKSKKPVKIVDDQFTTPTFLNEIPIVIETLYDLKKTGIYNLGSTECLSRFEFAEIVSTVFRLNNELILKAKTWEIPFIAKRPKNSCMSNEKLKSIVKINDIKTNIEKLSQHFT